MKKIFMTLLLVFFATAMMAQSLKITWEDDDGRPFAIIGPSGQFYYGTLSGDYISYDYNDRVSKVGRTYIQYNYNGKVSKVGDVYIQYDYNGRVSKVGGLYISYDYNGRVSRTSGQVRRR